MSNLPKILIGILIIALVIVGTTYILNNKNIKKVVPTATTPENPKDKSKMEVTDGVTKGYTDIIPIEDRQMGDSSGHDEQTMVWMQVHNLANGLIYAIDDKVNDILPMETKNVSKVLEMALACKDTKTDEKLIGILKDWQNCDFSHIVDDHNYVWIKLNGTLGLANRINQKGVDDAIVAMKKG
ncbi:MAG TPA: DUF6241 domain-containing protein [Clostridiaceae bacterium]